MADFFTEYENTKKLFLRIENLYKNNTSPTFKTIFNILKNEIIYSKEIGLFLVEKSDSFYNF